MCFCDLNFVEILFEKKKMLDVAFLSRVLFVALVYPENEYTCIILVFPPTNITCYTVVGIDFLRRHFFTSPVSVVYIGCTLHNKSLFQGKQ